MMKYFELFDIPVSFEVVEENLKAKFLELSKTFHPDRFTLASEEEQEDALERSTEINEGYKVLRRFDTRLHYILSQKGLLSGEGQDKLPQDFLMEMMDINEVIMDLQFDPDEAKTAQAKAQIKSFEDELEASIAKALANENAVEDDASLAIARDFYLKKKYLKRIYENLDKVGRM